MGSLGTIEAKLPQSFAHADLNTQQSWVTHKFRAIV
jgi:hypothetical protein